MKYCICGLYIESDIRLPESHIAQSLSTDARIKIASIPPDRDENETHEPIWAIKGADFALQLSGLMRLLVRAGHDVFVDPAPGFDTDEAVPFILSTGIATLLHQRGILALQAATVAWQGKAIGLCGATGTGKSTLAATLCQEGARLIGDDLAAIRPGDDGQAVICPDGRHHRLWADAVTYLNLTARQGAPVRPGLNKFYVAPAVEPECAPVPLSTIVLLEDRPDKDPPSPPMISDLSLVDALPLLREQIYRVQVAEKMGHEARIFQQTADLLTHVRVLRLERNRNLADLRANAQLLLSRIADID